MYVNSPNLDFLHITTLLADSFNHMYCHWIHKSNYWLYEIKIIDNAESVAGKYVRKEYMLMCLNTHLK